MNFGSVRSNRVKLWGEGGLYSRLIAYSNINLPSIRFRLDVVYKIGEGGHINGTLQ